MNMAKVVINICPQKQQEQLIWLFHQLGNSSKTDDKIPNKQKLESLLYEDGAPS